MTTDGDRDPDSILGNLQGEPISYEDAQNFDVTIDLLNRVATYLTGRMAEKRSAPDTNADELADLTRRREHYLSLRDSLVPDDTDQVTRLRQECVRVLKEEAGY